MALAPATTWAQTAGITDPQNNIPIREPRFTFTLTQEDRGIIASALEKKDDGPLHLVDRALQHVRSGAAVNASDFMVINGALMLSGDDRAPELLARMRAQIPK